MVQQIQIVLVDSFQLNSKSLFSSHSESLFENGIMEKQMSIKDKRIKFKKWIDDGVSFYDNENTFLPSHRLLLDVWNVHDSYPYVYSDTNSPIEGQYSLHIKSESKNIYYLFNEINPVSGYLSFKIKNNKEKCRINLFRYEYDKNNNIIVPKRINDIVICDNLVHTYIFYFDKSEFQGASVLFLMESDSPDIIIDELNYYPRF